MLVAAKRLDPEASSEGICTARFVYALSATGTFVAVLTGDEAATEASLRVDLPWLTGSLRHCTTVPAAPTDGRRHRLRTAVDLAGTAIDGHPTWYRRSVRAWREALESTLTDTSPEVLVTRGAGGGFEPHLAALALDPDLPWVAHYHDPWPASRWPEPYRAPRTRAMRLQERGHERILRRADALTFPSARLRDWVVGDDPDLLSKSHVVPHALDPWPAPPGADDALVADALERRFTLVHAGTLLNHRRIDGLVEGLARFVAGDPARAGETRLVLAGPVNASEEVGGGPGLAGLEAAGIVRRHERRLRRATARALVQGATAAVLIEAAGPESPFFPAKLTDYVTAGRPVLALSPQESVASDLMGEAHPLRVAPDDAPGIALALERLWEAAAAGTSDALCLDPATATTLTPTSVAAAFSDVLDTVMTPAGGKR